MSISGGTFSASRQAVSPNAGGLHPGEPRLVMQVPDKSRAGPGVMGFMEIAHHIQALLEQGTQLADAGEPAGPPDCVVSGPASGLHLFL